MALLWLNTIVAASASAIWFLWALKWYRRRQPILSAMYLTSSIGLLFFALGFMLVLVGGNPEASALGARQWAWAVAGIPAAARLIELLREENRHIYADRLLSAVEQRADRHDEESGQSP